MKYLLSILLLFLVATWVTAQCNSRCACGCVVTGVCSCNSAQASQTALRTPGGHYLGRVVHSVPAQRRNRRHFYVYPQRPYFIYPQSRLVPPSPYPHVPYRQPYPTRGRVVNQLTGGLSGGFSSPSPAPAPAPSGGGCPT
jgi:hypothetical protein